MYQSYCAVATEVSTGSAIYIGPLVKFLQFLSPFQKNFKTNDISYESPYKGCLESGKKLGVAPS